MKRFLSRETSKPKTALRNIVEDRPLPAVPEQRILPKNRSEVQHLPGAAVQVTNYDRKAHTFDLSVIPTSVAANVIDKALSAAAFRMRDEAAAGKVPYDDSAEYATMRFSGPAADMRKEAYWARHEARPAQPVLFRGEGVEMILTGLSELINEGERREAELKDFEFSGAATAAVKPDVSQALQTAQEARDVWLAIGGQINAELGNPAARVHEHAGSIAVGTETIDLTGQVAAVTQPAEPVGAGRK